MACWDWDCAGLKERYRYWWLVADRGMSVRCIRGGYARIRIRRLDE